MDQIEVLEAKIQGLRELMETNFSHIQKQLDTLQAAFENLAEATVTELKSQDRRLNKVEQISRVLQRIGVIAGAVLIAMLVALATGKAHIEWH